MIINQVVVRPTPLSSKVSLKLIMNLSIINELLIMMKTFTSASIYIVLRPNISAKIYTYYPLNNNPRKMQCNY